MWVNCQRIAYLSVSACLLMGQSGCALERSSVSVDSNSRSPWLGLQFLPSKKSDSSNYYRSISRQVDAGSEPTVIQTAAEPKRSEIRLSEWILPAKSPEPQVLPRTSEADLSGDQANETIEF
ncbi:hypothetical protein GC163_18575 [bacterium]|nr:hypothetical protein [bacterium]